YIRNLKAAENTRFAIMHISNQLVDPDDGKVLGYEGIYTATALVKRSGEPAKAVLIDPARETLAGDRLVSSDNDVPANFTPSVPSSQIHGHIIDVVGGTDLVGQFYVVAINRGKRHGIEPGTVLAVDQAGEVVRDLWAGGRSITNSMNGFNTTFVPRVKLPDERAGTMLVFKVYDRMSYGLIVGASNIIHNGAPVRNPYLAAHPALRPKPRRPRRGGACVPLASGGGRCASFMLAADGYELGPRRVGTYSRPRGRAAA